MNNNKQATTNMNKTKKTRTRYDFHVQNQNYWDWDCFVPKTEAAKAYLYLEGTDPNYEFGRAIGVDWKQSQPMAEELHDAGFKLKRIPVLKLGEEH
jgi:hypothetical protein